MRAELKEIDFISADVDLESYRPKNFESFNFDLELTIGIEGKDGGDLFQMTVCTPKWLLENKKSENIICGKII